MSKVRGAVAHQKARANIMCAESLYRGPIFDEAVKSAYDDLRKKPRSVDAKASIARLTDVLPSMIDEVDAFSEQPWAPVARSVVGLFENLSHLTGHEEIEILDTELMTLLDTHYSLSAELSTSHEDRVRATISLTILSALSYTAMRSNGAFVSLDDFTCSIETASPEGIAA